MAPPSGRPCWRALPRECSARCRKPATPLPSRPRSCGPAAANRSIYDELYAVYRDLYPALRPNFARLAALQGLTRRAPPLHRGAPARCYPSRIPIIPVAGRRSLIPKDVPALPVDRTRPGAILEHVTRAPLLFDGAMGTTINALEDRDWEAPEEVTLRYPERLSQIYRDYVEAGADVIHTNTFGGNLIRLRRAGLDDMAADINRRAAELAREAAGDRGLGGRRHRAER